MDSESDIIHIYKKLQETEPISPEYRNIIHEFNIRREEFDKNLTEEQRQELIDLLQLKTDLSGIDSREKFVEGYKRGARLILEILNEPDEEE